MKTVLMALCIVFFTLVAVVGGRHVYLQNSERQTVFLQGTVPEELPDGVYEGALAMATRWKGKRFDARTATGVNVFRDGINAMTDDLVFVMDIGPSDVEQGSFQVVKLDYDVPQNPWWVRWCKTEMVETEPGTFLGKIHVRVLPGVRVAVAFFELDKFTQRY